MQMNDILLLNRRMQWLWEFANKLKLVMSFIEHAVWSVAIAH